MQIKQIANQAIGYIDAQSDITAYRRQCIQLIQLDQDKGDPRYMEYKGHKLYKRSDGRWEVKYQDGCQRKSIYGRTQKECYDKFRAIFKEVEASVRFVNSYKLHSWLDYWLVTYKANRRSRDNDVTIRTIKRVSKDIELNKITVNYLQELINAVKTSRSRVSVYHVLNMALEKAYDNNLIKSNLMIKIEKPKHIKAPGKALTYEAENELKKKLVGHELRRVILFYLYSGCRRSEALSIKLSDIDFKENIVHIPGTKTADSDRIIPLFPQLVPLIDTSLHLNEYLFNFKADYITHEFHKLMPEYAVKDLRTTFATRMHENGIPSKYIQKWMGHTSMITTEKNYIKANNDVFERNLLEKLGKLTTN